MSHPVPQVVVTSGLSMLGEQQGKIVVMVFLVEEVARLVVRVLATVHQVFTNGTWLIHNFVFHFFGTQTKIGIIVDTIPKLVIQPPYFVPHLSFHHHARPRHGIDGTAHHDARLITRHVHHGVIRHTEPVEPNTRVLYRTLHAITRAFGE